MKKIGKLVVGGIEALTAIGVGTLVGGALVLVTPANPNLIKKMGIGLAGFAISCMAIENVNAYVDEQLEEIINPFKDQKLDETVKGVEA